MTNRKKPAGLWDSGRDGFVMGEGAGIAGLEDLDYARKRGASILAELIGYGMSADAYHITQPAEEGEGGYRVMMNAINDARITPSDVDYVNAHGTSTPIGDVLETKAIKRTFGGKPKLAVSSTKSMTGHLLGRRRRPGGGNHGLRIERPDTSAHHEPGTSRPGVRSRLRSRPGAQGAAEHCAFQFLWFWRHQWLTDF